MSVMLAVAAALLTLWGHTAGAVSNPADLRFLNDRIAAFLRLNMPYRYVLTNP
jgi:hypothetical protein